DDFEQLCKLGIDTVYIAVPNFLHFEYCKMALEKGLNVIVEKPITSNYKEALILQDIARENKLFLFEAITTLYLENYLKIKELIPRIGNIKIVQSQFSQYSRRYDDFIEGKILPVFDPNKSGGALMDLNLYNVHYVMGLFGMPQDVHYYPNIERNIDTSGTLMLTYQNFIAMCVAAKDCKGICGGVIQGTKGSIKSFASANKVGEVVLELNDGTIERFHDESNERFIPEFNTFIKVIKNRDFEFCYKQLEKTLAVSQILTRARLQSGIYFPSDNK
ncbi:Gfo/Idh/MocA family protein, partial [Intestinibacter sp.]|uniref:Gfo/Idh/MocA family protein n=1 Tax=Intestinibacter sp. TaxID=1965304 RepID=UPI003F16DF0A